jgi:hypothetical protein
MGYVSAADAGAAAAGRWRPDRRKIPVGGVSEQDPEQNGKIAGVKLTTDGVLLLAARRRSADDLCGAARRPAYPQGCGRASDDEWRLFLS